VIVIAAGGWLATLPRILIDGKAEPGGKASPRVHLTVVRPEQDQPSPPAKVSVKPAGTRAVTVTGSVVSLSPELVTVSVEYAASIPGMKCVGAWLAEIVRSAAPRGASLAAWAAIDTPRPEAALAPATMSFVNGDLICLPPERFVYLQDSRHLDTGSSSGDAGRRGCRRA
jgi:hypothetical protein